MRRLLPFALALLLSAGAPTAFAATNISSVTEEHFSWNDLVGWFNFYSADNVNVGDTRLTGWANSAAGQISLDCATSPSGNICGTSNYYVSNNGAGTLAGYAWSDAYGWISFNSSNHAGAIEYGVYVDPNTGIFTGFAWNDVIGWISFNSEDIGSSFEYRVETSWRFEAPSGAIDSTPFDTGVEGAQVNGVTWTGATPGNTEVRIQIATSPDAEGPWSFVGPDGTGTSYYSPDSGVGVPLYPWIHPAGRYFAYRLHLLSDNLVDTPRVDDVVVRWSP